MCIDSGAVTLSETISVIYVPAKLLLLNFACVRVPIHYDSAVDLIVIFP